MLPFLPSVPDAKAISVSASPAQFDLAMAATFLYMYVASTNTWIKQGAAYLITLDDVANLAESDTVSITADGETVIYELDVTGDGGTGDVVIDVSGATTAADVGALLATAITANQPALTVTDVLDGTVRVQANGRTLAVTVSAEPLEAEITSLVPTAGSGSMYVPANTPVLLDSKRGPYIAAIRDSANGGASLTRVTVA